MNFNQHHLSEEMLQGLSKMKFSEPTPVQSKTIAPMLEKLDLLVQSPTGSGKTCAFGIPAIEAVEPKNRSIQTVILSPTRELALQTKTVLHNLATFKHSVRIIALYGGEPIGKQISALRKQPQIVVATPGRLMDHIQRRTVKLDKVNLVVLDEADRMLDMGFRDDMDMILSNVPAERQTVLFSATLSKEICKVAESYQTDPKTIQIAQEFRTVDSVEQFYTEVSKGMKNRVLEIFLKERPDKQTLVFVGTKSMADKLSAELSEKGIRAEALHGGLRQTQRDRVMSRFRKGFTQILIATDVAARGIDVQDMGAVINYDIPATSDDYVHRIGRTGRANHTGVAYTFLYPKERGQLQMIMRETKAVIRLKRVEGLPPVEKAPAEKRSFAKKKPYHQKKNFGGKKPGTVSQNASKGSFDRRNKVRKGKNAA